MHPRSAGLALMTLLLGVPALAQHATSPTVRAAPPEARQFAFLVGTHELTVKPAVSGLAARIHGAPTLVGTWKGWRAMDGFGVEDELRITDESGNPRSLAHAMRFYDANTKRWLASTVDVYRGVISSSTGIWQDNSLVTTSRGNDAEAKAYVSGALLRHHAHRLQVQAGALV